MIFLQKQNLYNIIKITIKKFLGNKITIIFKGNF